MIRVDFDLISSITLFYTKYLSAHRHFDPF